MICMHTCAMSSHYLLPLLAPRSVAVIGASEREGALGRFVFENMLGSGFQSAHARTLYAVNPKYRTVLGEKCFRSVGDLPSAPDLIVVASPANTVADVLKDAGALGVKNAVVLSAGFGEIGDEGRARTKLVKEQLARYDMRMIGPNCVGIMRPAIGLNATFANAACRAGPLALVAQSGAVCTALLDWAATTEIGFSSVVSLGGALDLDFGEVLDFLVHDTETRSILLYVEGIRDARGFISSLRAAARVKPVVVYKAGRHSAGTKAVTSHTGALAGSDAVFDAALARSGAVRVSSSVQLFAAARVLASKKRPAGPRLGIVTNGGGPAVVAADAAVDNHLELATLSKATIEKLNAALPAHWSKANPVDIIGDATPARFTAAAEAVVEDAGVDALLVLFCPQRATTPEAAAAAIIPIAQQHDKPVFTAFLGGASIVQARTMLEKADIANFMTPENAVEAMSFLVRFKQHQEMLLESVPAFAGMSSQEASSAVAEATRIRALALREKRTLLSEMEAKTLLFAFGIPVKLGKIAATREEAQAAAKAMGYPVAMKIHSPDITHKSDVGGVRLNLINTKQVGHAFDDMMEQVKRVKPKAKLAGVNIQPMLKFPHQREVLVGLKRDAVFGPVIAFGAGGIAVEALHDLALALPPLNPRLAMTLMQSTQIRRVLNAYRDVPAIDDNAIIDVLQRISTMACLLPWVEEMDLNPVLVHPAGAAVVDARVVINAAMPVTDARYQHMAIFPYPIELERDVELKNGSKLLLRAIRPDDAEREHAFVAKLSPASRYARFQYPLSALSPEMMARFTQLDYDREMALLALVPETGEIVGVARYFPNPDRASAEFACVVADAWQGRGVGSLLMTALIDCARTAGYTSIDGAVLSTNTGMLALAERLGFVVQAGHDPNHTVKVVLALKHESKPE
ncbi:MAG: bifunctional acetate--CoA ligase family protein/GNAT family N-acetyltransferase [Burkholderiales bacterium]|nr:bifunctional acetate--CoA ligase family protein/GNAT family N-acetyltransferase [Burkholderiales bacterium]